MEITSFHKDLERFLLSLQENICKELERADGSPSSQFQYETWVRKEGGGGRSSLLMDGQFLEKGGVNFSAVYGAAPEFLFREKEHSMASGSVVQTPLSSPPEFYATGLSLVIHPGHPFIPIIHMNIRYFELSTGEWWLGGGIDVTPHYVIPEQARWFHLQLKNLCDRYHPDFYPRFKAWADDYFFLPHRNETRGIGGIFFDRLNDQTSMTDKQTLFDFWKAVGNIFSPLYTHLIQCNQNTPWNEQHKSWQLFRRSRYAEFNLLFDKGTRFGIETGGRTESILMSLPPETGWKKNLQPEEGTPESLTLSFLKKNIAWTETNFQ